MSILGESPVYLTVYRIAMCSYHFNILKVKLITIELFLKICGYCHNTYLSNALGIEHFFVITTYIGTILDSAIIITINIVAAVVVVFVIIIINIVINFNSIMIANVIAIINYAVRYLLLSWWLFDLFPITLLSCLLLCVC